MKRLAFVLAAALAAGCSGKDSLLLSHRYSAEVPAGWKKSETLGRDATVVYVGRDGRISASRRGGRWTPGVAAAEQVSVDGREAPLYRTTIEVSASGPENPGLPSESLLQDIVVLQDAGGYWALAYTRAAPGPAGPSPSDEPWRRFLKTFRLNPPS